MDWKLIAVTFATIFVAELGDKTQLAVIAAASKTAKPWTVFVAASAALVVVTLLGALVGATLTHYVPAAVLHKIAGVLFVAIGILILTNVV